MQFEPFVVSNCTLYGKGLPQAKEFCSLVASLARSNKWRKSEYIKMLLQCIAVEYLWDLLQHFGSHEKIPTWLKD